MVSKRSKTGTSQKQLMDLKTLSEFTTLLVSGNPVISQAQECQTTMGLGRALSMLWMLVDETKNVKLHGGPRKSCKIEFKRKGAQNPPVVKVVYYKFSVRSMWNLFMIACDISNLGILNYTQTQGKALTSLKLMTKLAWTKAVLRFHP